MWSDNDDFLDIFIEKYMFITNQVNCEGSFARI